MDQRLSHWLVLAALFVLLMAACGRTAAPRASQGTVDVGQDEAGRTVEVRVGQRIVLNLGPVTSRSLTWKLLDYPRRLVSLASNGRGGGRFEFRAETAGIGEIKAALVAECGPPLPAAIAGSVGCPVGGRADISVPLRRFDVTVQVT